MRRTLEKSDSSSRQAPAAIAKVALDGTKGRA